MSVDFPGRCTLDLGKKLLRGFVVLAVTSVFVGCAGSLFQRSKPLTLVWYGLVRTGPFQESRYVPLEDGVTLATDDGIQLFLTVEPDAYFYALHQTTTGQFAVLWPAEEGGFSAFMEGGRVQTLPSRGRVYTMEFGQGTAALYLIASRKPIDSVGELLREMRTLFTTAQAIAVGIPAEQIKRSIPNNVEWKLDLKNPIPVELSDQHVPVATSVRSIGRIRTGAEELVTTAEGGHYTVRAEQISGDNVVARVVRFRRVVTE